MDGGSVTFDRAAGYYDQTRGFPPGVEQGVAETIARAAHLKPTDRVLEIGIGTGRIALPLAPYVRACYGVDLAASMIDRLVEKRDSEPVYPLLADATRLPFADATFDAVIAVHIFHLIPAYKQAFQEAARVLKPGGVLAHGWNLRHVEGFLNQVWHAATGASSLMLGISFEEREKMLPAHGWQLKSDDHYPYLVERAPARFLEDMRGRVYSHCWTMPEEVLQNGLAALRAYMAEHGIDPEQPRAIETEFRVQTFQPPG